MLVMTIDSCSSIKEYLLITFGTKHEQIINTQDRLAQCMQF